jgi:hypothetical protein
MMPSLFTYKLQYMCHFGVLIISVDNNETTGFAGLCNHGGPQLHLVQPQYIILTDDTTQYIFKGADPKGNSQWVLCNPDDLEKCGTRGMYVSSAHPQATQVRMGSVVPREVCERVG